MKRKSTTPNIDDYMKESRMEKRKNHENPKPKFENNRNKELFYKHYNFPTWARTL